MSKRIDQYFIELDVAPDGTLQHVVAGGFGASAFTIGRSVYDPCPYLIGTLDHLEEGEPFAMDGMVLVWEGKEYNTDVEMYREPTGVTVLLHNRTNVYKMVDQLNQHRNDLFFLKRELGEKNVELERLRQAADKANEEKTRFLAMMSHEVRNPLNVILGYTEMINKEPVSQEVEDHLKYLTASGRTLKILVDDILDLSRVEAGKLELSQAPIQFSEIMDQIKNSYKSSHRDIEIALHFELDQKVPSFVLGDDVRIYQIITNLMNNSIKFTPSGSVTTRIGLMEDRGNEVLLQMSVKDTGRGMTQEQADSVFEEYKQNTLDDNRIHKGAGLGLSIVKRLVTAMNGTIAVKSEVGVGTDFSIEVPFERASNEQISSAAVAVEEVKDYIPGSSILAADDNHMNRRIVAHILKKKEVELVLVKDGVEALEAMQGRQFDLVLLDINMPNLSGEALIQQRAAYEQDNASTPFVALTGNTSKEDVEGYYELGFSDVIPKPFTAGQFLEIVNANLAKSSNA